MKINTKNNIKFIDRYIDSNFVKINDFTNEIKQIKINDIINNFNNGSKIKYVRLKFIENKTSSIKPNF